LAPLPASKSVVACLWSTHLKRTSW